MLKRLELKNFESHKHTTIDFDSGVNVIRGLSNSGKSSLMRAMQLVAYGEWNKEWLRSGAKLAIVKVTTDNGRVTCKRGGTTNKWIIKLKGKTYTYTSPGKDVPPEATEVLGFGKVEIGGQSMALNMAHQLEKHFLISEIDGKKATQSLAAKMIDDLGGIMRVEELFDSLNKDRTTGQKEERDAEQAIEGWVDRRYDDEEINLLEKKVAKAKKIDDSIKRIEERIKRFEELKKRADRIKETQNRLDRISDSIKLDDANDLLREFEVVVGKVKLLEDASNRRNSTNNRLATNDRERKKVEHDLKNARATLTDLLDGADTCPFSGGKLYEDCKELINA